MTDNPPPSLDALRQELEREADLPWIVISAADPVNLFGVITAGLRIPATHRNALVMQGGRLVASRQAGTAEFYEPLDEATQWAMRRAMTLGRRPAEKPEPPVQQWLIPRH